MKFLYHNIFCSDTISVLQIAPVAVSDAAMLAPEEIFEGKGDIKEEGELTQAERKRRRANKKRRYAGTFPRPFREDFWLSFTLWLLLRTLFNLLSHLFKLSIKWFLFSFSKCRITQGEASQVAERLDPMFVNQRLPTCHYSILNLLILSWKGVEER